MPGLDVKGGVVLLACADEAYASAASESLSAVGLLVRACSTGRDARALLAIGDARLAVVANNLPDDDGAELAAELRATNPDLVLVLLVQDEAELLRTSLADLSVDDVCRADAGAQELAWRVTGRMLTARLAGAERRRERFLRGVVRIVDVFTPYADLPTLTRVLAPALLGLPAVEGVRITLAPESVGDAPVVVLEAGATAPGLPLRALDLDLRSGAGGVLRLLHRDDLPIDEELGEALGALVGAVVSSARQFGTLKERQLRLERGYVDRHHKLSRVSTRLERLSESRDSFLALLSHDLRSPLAVVLGQVQLLEENLVGPAQIPRVASTVRRQAERMVQMVEDLLDRYRRDDAIRSVPEGGDAVRIVSEMMEAIRPLATDRQQKLSLSAPSVARIEADVAAIREVLANVLENAVRHSPPGSAMEVEIVTDDARAHITIRDQGPGFGARPQPAPGGSGLSLGLRASARIVADAGGHMRTATGANGGGQVVITLPLALPRAASSGVELYADEGPLGDRVADLLTPHWELRRLPSLGGAIERMRATVPHLVVLALGGERDEEAAAFVRRLKSDVSLAAVPVIVVSAASAHFHEAGALAVLDPPLDGSLLVGNVRRALRLQGEGALGDTARDMLTGLPTAAALSERLDSALAQARAQGMALPLLLLRILDLRQINRQHGWLVGDQLILWLARQLNERTATGGDVARVDAETFAVALTGRTMEEAEAFAKELSASIERARPRLGVARVDVRVSTTTIDLSALVLGGDSLLGAVRGGRET